MDPKSITPTRVKIARAVAIAADFLQIVVFPVFAPGFASAPDDVIDVVVCGILTWLVGWHFSFLPSFMLKVVPMVDLAPTWTLAVFFATRKKKEPQTIDAASVVVETPVPPKLNPPPNSVN